jgi:trk system potassium uptake protein TrkH
MLQKSIIIMISGFAGFILLGSLLLSLPIATVGPPLDYIDALFTATSAVCVTGLIVVDTAKAFTGFGQIVILSLIQLGGLGIITFSVIMLLLLGKRVSLVQKEAFRMSQVGREFQFDLVTIGLRILAFVALTELAGIILLTVAFLRYFPIEVAVYHAAFQSISAFCNAGFSTFSTSMTQFSGDPFVLAPMMLLIVLGGIGFMVILDLEEKVRFGRPLTLQTRIVLQTTLVLLLLGAVLFFLTESGNSMAGKPLGEQVMGSFFHSVTCRTAGFNTVDYYQLTNATLVLTMLLMVIGGSPGSTAGGIKTTTAAIIYLTAAARLRGKHEPEFRNRSIEGRSVTEAITLTALVVLFIMVIGIGLQVSELGQAPHSKSPGGFLELSFETVSAFGTVGLSMGATPKLTPMGKILIICTMFIGRLGPLTFFSLLSLYLQKPKYKLYAESVMVG